MFVISQKVKACQKIACKSCGGKKKVIKKCVLKKENVKCGTQTQYPLAIKNEIMTFAAT